MRATLHNLSPVPREHWCAVTFPSLRARNVLGPEATFVLDDGRRWRATRGRTVMGKTTYRIRANMSGGQKLRGTMRPEAHPDSARPFELHRWVSDDFMELVPNVKALAGDVPVDGGAPDEARVVDSSPVHQRWLLRRRIPQLGLHFTYWADLLHGDPVIPFKGKVVWSDPSDPRDSRVFKFIVVSAGEAMVFDFARRHGIVGPIGQGRNFGSLLASDVTIGDAMGLPLSGSMLAFVSGDEQAPFPQVEESVRNLRAAALGPIVGSCDEWGEEWLASVPRLDPATYRSQSEADWAAFASSLESHAGWTADRPVGLGRTPGQTGAQEDFGATKGTYVVAERDPRHIYRLQYAVQAELFRGTNHYGPDGLPLRLDEHGNWVTWSGATHYHRGVSPDRLGKGDMPLLPAMGWNGYDDEHRSQNNLAAYLMLSDDPMMEEQVDHMATVDLAAYRVKFPQFGAGPARAQGRTVGALAHLADVVPPTIGDRLMRAVLARMGATIASPSLAVPGPMKVLSWGTPDGRKPIFEADGVTLGRWTSLWEHGLALVGIHNLTRHGHAPGSVEERWHEAALIVARTMRDFGCFMAPDGRWHIVADMLWSDGAPPPGGMVPNSKHFTSGPDRDAVQSWTFAGLLVARELLGADQKLDACIQAMTGGREASDRVTAEWWAAVRG